MKKLPPSDYTINPGVTPGGVAQQNGLEPYFNWRSRWVLTEDAQHMVYRLREDIPHVLPAMLKTDDGHDRGALLALHQRLGQLLKSMAQASSRGSHVAA